MTADIIKTQQGLARKALAQPSHRFTDLYHLLHRREWIEEALQHVLTNDGATTPGVDGMRWKHFNDVERSDFENERFRQRFIDEVQRDLRLRTFRPLPVRRVEIPKPGSLKRRPLGIPTIRDRVVQTLLKMVLEPIWEADFVYFSNGFRPGRCTMDCVQPLYKLCGTRTGYRWVIEGDIRACFEAIPHDKLVATVARRIADRHVLTLVTRFLKSGIMSEGRVEPSTRGTPQGGPLSPLLANCYLHQFDEWYRQRFASPDKRTDPLGYGRWRYRREKGKDVAAVQMFRYADDWISVVRGTKAQAEEVKQACKAFLCDDLGLDLSEEKTKVTHIQDGFDFLGYHIFRCNRASNGRRVGVFARPTTDSQRRLKAKIKAMTGRRTLDDDYLLKIQALNAVVRGWAMYYRAVNSTSTFQGIDQYVWLRLRTWLEKKHRCGPKQVRQRYMRHRSGPRGGMDEFAAQDAQERWIYRSRATNVQLVYHRPWLKRYWPHPYLEPVPAQAYAFPALDDRWEGTSRAPEYVANRRLVMQRAGGRCEHCGQRARLVVHHRNRRHYGRRPMARSDNRPEMMEALCTSCHEKEHRAEVVAHNKLRVQASAAARST